MADVRRVSVWTASDNHRALRLYAHAGLRRTGEQQGIAGVGDAVRLEGPARQPPR